MKLRTLFFLGVMSISNLVYSQLRAPFALSDEWLSEIQTLAPVQATVQTDMQKHILIFSLHTGFEHWTIPHTEAVIKLIT